MIAIFLHKVDDALAILDDPELDYTQFNNQLLGELRCGRLTVFDTLRVYEKLVEKHNYVMTPKDLQQLVYYFQLYVSPRLSSETLDA